MIDHYHNLKVRYASLKGSIVGESVELIAPIVVLLVAGAAILYFLDPDDVGGFVLGRVDLALMLLLGLVGAIFLVLAYLIEIFPRSSLWGLIVAGVAVALASVPFTLWLADALPFAALEMHVVPPSAWPIGGVFFLYGAIIAACAAFSLVIRSAQ